MNDDNKATVLYDEFLDTSLDQADIEVSNKDAILMQCPPGSSRDRLEAALDGWAHLQTAAHHDRTVDQALAWMEERRRQEEWLTIAREKTASFVRGTLAEPLSALKDLLFPEGIPARAMARASWSAAQGSVEVQDGEYRARLVEARLSERAEALRKGATDLTSLLPVLTVETAAAAHSPFHTDPGLAQQLSRAAEMLSSVAALQTDVAVLQRERAYLQDAVADGRRRVAEALEADRAAVAALTPEREQEIAALAAETLQSAGLSYSLEVAQGKAVPVDLKVLTEELGLYVWEVPLADLEGLLLTDGERGAVLVNADQKESRRRRFTLAHEIGHFVLHVGEEGVFADGRAQLTDDGAVAVAVAVVEREANLFASYLLVPEEGLSALTNEGETVSPSLALALEISTSFDVSLMAAVYRILHVADRPCAFVSSRGRVVERYATSTGFRGNICLGSRLPSSSTAAQADVKEVAEGIILKGRSELSEWLGMTILEESCRLPRGWVYTLLTEESETDH